MTGEARTPQEGALEHVRWIVQQANEHGRWHLSGKDLIALEALVVPQEGSALVETQAWREQIERVRNAHHHAHMMLHFELSDCPVCAALDALTAQIEELEANTRHLRNLHDWRAKGEREALIRLAVVEDDLASSQEAALLLQKRVEELEKALTAAIAEVEGWGPQSTSSTRLREHMTAALAARTEEPR